MKYQNVDKKSYQVRLNKQAFEHLEKLLPAIQATRSNVTKTDVASEALLAMPLPEVSQPKQTRRTRKATETPISSAMAVA